MLPHSRIYVAGHNGLVGSAICRRLRSGGFTNLIVRSSSELDLRNQSEVERFFQAERPEFVFLAAAKVGGILANSQYPADFIYDNLAIQNNVIRSAWAAGTAKLLFLGSSCIYPRNAPQPIREEYLLSGTLEPTNEWYAVAKIAGLKLAQAFRMQYGFDAVCAMPTNLYGPGDNFDLTGSHVLPALLRKFGEAGAQGLRSVTVWGSGMPRREFLHVDDLADASVFLMLSYSDIEPVNVGTGVDVTIAELAEIVRQVTGFQGEIVFDRTRPDGTPRKLLDVGKLSSLGWKAKTELREGIAMTWRWYCDNLVAPKGNEAPLRSAV